MVDAGGEQPLVPGGLVEWESLVEPAQRPVAGAGEGVGGGGGQRPVDELGLAAVPVRCGAWCSSRPRRPRRSG
ncbi:hypothetical protein ACWC2H_28655 [Streptomyces sp. 900105755]